MVCGDTIDATNGHFLWTLAMDTSDGHGVQTSNTQHPADTGISAGVLVPPGYVVCVTYGVVCHPHILHIVCCWQGGWLAKWVTGLVTAGWLAGWLTGCVGG